jgi:hypothetical protein
MGIREIVNAGQMAVKNAVNKNAPTLAAKNRQHSSLNSFRLHYARTITVTTMTALCTKLFRITHKIKFQRAMVLAVHSRIVVFIFSDECTARL